jgi:hypothetical protein
MRQFLDRFILAIPVLFIKQFPYAWIAAVVLWTWPPGFSWIFFGIIVVGLLMLHWQSAAWISNLRREHAFAEGKFHVDQPPVPIREAVQKFPILLVGAVLIAWFLQGRFGLNFWQYFFIVLGFTILYQDTRFFGAPTTYVITDQGIGIRFVPGHIDYRLFLSFKEISRLEKRAYQKGENWDLFARTREPGDGLLMIPKNTNGFTRRIDKLFIAPRDVGKFLEQLPQGYQ